MKVLFALLVLPALVFANQEKRFVLDSILAAVNSDTIKQDLQLMIDLVGSDPTEQACEQAGHKYLSGLLDHSVPLICHSFQELIHHFNIAPAQTTTASAAKRFVLDTLLAAVNTDTIKQDLQLMIDVVGSDPTEQACEQAGHKYLSGLLDHSVPLICHSFQELIHHFNIAPAQTTTASAAKRFVLDTLLAAVNGDTIKQDLQLMIDLVGSDPTEQACEQAGHKYLSGLLDHSVPLICHSFQELVHHFNIVPAQTTTASAAKRFVLDTLLAAVNTDTIKQDLQLMIDVVGSDPTEQACEQAGHKYLSGLLDHSVPLICHSFQELVHHFHIVPAQTTTASAAGKRYLLDTLSNLVNLDTIKKDLQLMIDVVGSDPTEQACEQAGHKILSGLLDHSVPLICHSFQELVHHFHIVPVQTTTASAAGKRYLLDTLLNLVNLNTIKQDLQLMIDVVGSDPTEQACEQAGHKYLSGLLDHSVPLICHSFQELVHHFHIVPAQTTTASAAAGKRYLLDTLSNLVNLDTIKKDLQLMIDVVGSDPTEQACEQAGHKYLSGLLDHSVPLICHSFQELVHHFHIVPAQTTTASAAGKRYLLDTLSNLVNLDTIKKDLQLMIDVVGSDPTEQACEQAGHKYLSGLLDHSVPLICHSFQELVHHFSIVPAQTTTASAAGKRYLLNTLSNLVNLDTIKKDLQLMIDVVGSDPTEQACEQAGHKYLSGLLDHSVPLICHSFQELVHHFSIVPSQTASP
ncbi:uncharacterized protein LOC132760638 isoform X6 [Ruditapes philippinarum]|uniref:uncharacterized protein LOC132760638 isoform X6 n=1 Tax=Ruditapes philippinarum TaxID=129788 RepID=UPI00295ACFC2|nr:uncharacterized protein LOC132760638 isoform X6 [Ruditapes philippinarum]